MKDDIKIVSHYRLSKSDLLLVKYLQEKKPDMLYINFVPKFKLFVKLAQIGYRCNFNPMLDECMLIKRK